MFGQMVPGEAEAIELFDDRQAVFVECVLVLREVVEMGEEFREGDGRGFRSIDFGIAFGAQGRNGKRHGNAMVRA